MGITQLPVTFAMSTPETILKNVNVVNYNPRWPQTILVVAVLLSTFVVTLCLLIIHIPVLILMQELSKSWSNGFVTAFLIMGFSLMTCMKTLFCLFMLLRHSLSPGIMFVLTTIGSVIWGGVTIMTTIWANLNRDRVCKSEKQLDWACKNFQWVYALEGILLCLLLVLLMLSIHAVRREVSYFDAPHLSRAKKCNPDIRLLGPALTPPINMPVTLDLEYIRQLSTQQLSAAEVGYLHTVMTSDQSFPPANQKPQAVSRCSTNEPVGVKKCVLPGRLNESNNLGFKPGRLLFGPSLLEPSKIHRKMSPRRAPPTALSHTICSSELVDTRNSHQQENQLGASTSKLENRTEQTETPRNTIERGHFNSSLGEASYHGYGCIQHHSDRSMHTKTTQRIDEVYSPYQNTTKSIAVDDSYICATINHDDYNSTLKITLGQPLSFPSPPLANSADFRVGTSTSGTTLAPSPRTCSMVNIQKLVNRSGSILSTSSASHSEGSFDSSLDPDGTFSYDSHSTGVGSYITSTKWQQHQHLHTYSSANPRSDDVVVAPLSISQRKLPSEDNEYREDREDLTNQEPSIDCSGGITEQILLPNPLPITSRLPIRDIALNTRNTTSMQTPNSFSPAAAIHSHTTASSPSRQSRTPTTPLKTQMIGHFTLSPSGVVELNGASNDIKLPLGEWNSMGRWVVRNIYHGNVQEEGAISEDGGSDPFKLEAEVQALGFHDGAEKRAGKRKVKEVRFNV